jgi:ABC-type multidrug transport system ATPase subunit
VIDFTDLTLAAVSRNFGRRRALSRVSLSCRAGEIVGLLGPNGAGKSTLLSIIATLLAPSSGEVRYGPYQASDGGGALRGRIGVLAHDLHLYPELTAGENLEFFARLYGVPSPAGVVARALEHAGLADRRDDFVSGFSRGMRQRLALERALLHGPRLLLLDEPFTGLDDAATRALVARLQGLRSEGCIVLLATHDLETVEGVLDRAAILRDGRLIAMESLGAGLRRQYRDQIAGTTGMRNEGWPG